MKTVLKMGLSIILCVIVGILLLFLVYLIPTEGMEERVKHTAAIFEEEGSWGTFNIPLMNTTYDNYSDALMLLEASEKNQDNALVSALLNNRRAIKNEECPAKMIVKHYKEGKEFDSTIMYGRYWNGYLILLKPLFSFFEYSTLRVLNACWQILLMGFVCYLFYKQRIKQYILPYLVSVSMIMPAAIVINFQLSHCFSLMNGWLIVLLLCKEKLEKWGVYIFLFFGIVTVYYDNFTYPLITFGVPAVLYFCLMPQETFKQSTFRMLKIGSSWLFGYAGMWMGKWIFASLLTGRNFISEGFGLVVFRAGTNGGNFSPLTALSYNFEEFFGQIQMVFAGAFVITLLALIDKKKQSIGKANALEILKSMVPFVYLVLLPIAWYICVVNHSVIHAPLFANKNLIILMMSLTCFLAKIYTEKEKKEETEKIEG